MVIGHDILAAVHKEVGIFAETAVADVPADERYLLPLVGRQLADPRVCFDINIGNRLGIKLVDAQPKHKTGDKQNDNTDNNEQNLRYFFYHLPHLT